MLKNIKKMLLALLIGITFGFTSNVYALYGVASSSNTANPGEVIATKTAQVVSGGDGRSVDISFNVSGTSFTQSSQVEREIVLVLDDSGSMDEYVGNITKVSALKTATNELVNNLLSADNAGKVKVGIVTYGDDVKSTCALSNSKDSLNTCINNLNGNGGTNIQAGLKAGNKLFTNSTTSVKSLILLSDGIPTFYTDSNGVRHGTGSTDEHEVAYCDAVWPFSGKCYDNSGDYIGDGFSSIAGSFVEDNTGMKPSEAAIAEAEAIDATLYTVGFDIGSGSDAETFLKNVASSTDKYYPANSIDSLKVAFAAISDSINVIAEDVRVVDVIPNTFSIDTYYFITNFGQATTLEDGSIKYGDSVIVKDNGDDGTEVTWLIGNLDATKANDLTIRVTAKEDYYGNMFTNDGAMVIGTAVDGNKFYEESNSISISLADPSVVIPAVANADEYSVNQGATLNVNKTLGLRNNDSKSVQNANEAEVVDEVLVVTGVSKGALKVNKDGSFTYEAPTDYFGDVTFTYYIKTTVELDGRTYHVTSNTATVTITINRIATTYTVIHYINGTSIVLGADGGEGYVYESATGYAFDFENYQLIEGEPTSKTITLVDGSNIITFYYELEAAANVTVHYYIEGTTTKLTEDVVLSGKVTENYKSEALSFDNYELVATPTNANGVFTKDAQEVVYYYRLKAGANVTVHYYIEGTTTKLAEDVVLSGKVTECYTSEALSFDNYELVATPANANGVFTKDAQEVFYYYRLIKGGDVTVHHYLEGTTTKLAADTILKGKINETYVSAHKFFDNYELVATPANASGKFTKEAQEVIYYYRLKQGASVTVHYYIQGTTTKLADDVVLEGKLTEGYTTDALDFDNYELVATPANANGVFTKDSQEVVYYYRLKTAGNVVVHHYIEGTTTKLANDVILSGKVTETYITVAKKFDNYELVARPVNAIGKFTKEAQEVIYYYRLKQGGTVTVYYLEKGTTNELADTIKLNGKVTESYESNALDIANWKLVEVSENANGKFTLEEQVVIYYYEKVMGTVTVKYVDVDGNELSETIILEGQTGTTYETEELVIDGYVFKAVEGTETGEFTEEEITVVYVYEKVQPVIDTEEVSPVPNTGVFSDNSNLIVLVLSLVLTTGLVVFRKKISE